MNKTFDIPQGPVLICVDDSSHAEYAAQYYMTRQHQPKDHVIIVHIGQINIYLPDPNIPLRHDIAQELLNKAVAESKKVTDKFQKYFTEKGVQSDVICEVGSPGETIVRLAKDKEAQLVVMGTRGQGVIRRTLMGSVSDYVLHHCHCPMLLCRK